jgi:hypothetical protein
MGSTTTLEDKSFARTMYAYESRNFFFHSPSKVLTGTFGSSYLHSPTFIKMLSRACFMLAALCLFQSAFCDEHLRAVRLLDEDDTRQPYSLYNARALDGRDDDEAPCSKDNPCKTDLCCNGVS